MIMGGHSWSFVLSAHPLLPTPTASAYGAGSDKGARENHQVAAKAELRKPPPPSTEGKKKKTYTPISWNLCSMQWFFLLSWLPDFMSRNYL